MRGEITACVSRCCRADITREKNRKTTMINEVTVVRAMRLRDERRLSYFMLYYTAVKKTVND